MHFSIISPISSIKFHSSEFTFYGGFYDYPTLNPRAPGATVAGSMIAFDVTYEGYGEEKFPRECEVIYSYDAKNPQETLEGYEDYEIACMEILGEFP